MDEPIRQAHYHPSRLIVDKSHRAIQGRRMCSAGVENILEISWSCRRGATLTRVLCGDWNDAGSPQTLLCWAPFGLSNGRPVTLIAILTPEKRWRKMWSRAWEGLLCYGPRPAGKMDHGLSHAARMVVHYLDCLDSVYKMCRSITC